MSERRFRLLETEMIRRGVALRHARRAALELEGHYRELVDQALARDETPEQAQQSAHEALGSDAVLIDRYTREKELRSWAYPWRAVYLLAPLLGFACLFVAMMAALIAASGRLSTELHHVSDPRALVHDVNLALTVLLLWVMPAVIAMGVGALAGRQHIALRWLSAGIVVLSIITAQMNVRFAITSGSPHGLVGAGIGLSTGHLPYELLHVLALVALTLIPAAWLRRRVMSRWLALE